VRDVHGGERQVLLRFADLLVHMPTQLGVQIGQRLAHSSDRERPIRSIMNTDSGDHEHPLAVA
jgi:hypothetical protein